MFGTARVERKITALYKIMKIWRRRDQMAWADVTAKVDELKAAWKKVSEDLVAMHAKFDECMKQDQVDKEALEALKADLGSLAGEMVAAHHADGM